MQSPRIDSGSTLDYVKDNPYGPRIGVPKLSYVGLLAGAGVVAYLAFGPVPELEDEPGDGSGDDPGPGCLDGRRGPVLLDPVVLVVGQVERQPRLRDARPDQHRRRHAAEDDVRSTTVWASSSAKPPRSATNAPSTRA